MAHPINSCDMDSMDTLDSMDMADNKDILVDNSFEDKSHFPIIHLKIRQ